MILSCLSGDVSDFKNIFEINIKEITSGIQDDILSVDEYIKAMILKFEDRYPDTELSKRLGMSRKSLWEKERSMESQKEIIKKKQLLSMLYL